MKVYQFWSLLYQRIYHKKYKKDLLRGLTPDHAQNIMNQVQWSKDTPKELWDAIGSPHWFQYVYDETIRTGVQPEGALDCDEYAFWAANSINNKYLPEVASGVWLVSRRDESGKLHYDLGGHHVCLVRGDRFFHVGNWGKSKTFSTEDGLIQDLIKSGANNTEDVEIVILAKWNKNCRIKNSKFISLK